jgi:hypothetical protein
LEARESSQTICKHEKHEPRHVCRLSIGDDSSNDRQKSITIPNENLEEGDLVESIFGSEMIQTEDEVIFNKIILTTKNDLPMLSIAGY